MIKKIYFLIKNFILDTLFPRICIGCGKEGEWVCDGCLKTIDIIKAPFCPECRRMTKIGEFCDNCKNISGCSLDGIFICANFGEGVLKEMIHQFKYNGVFDIGETLGGIMVGKLKIIFVGASLKTAPVFDLVVPVPLHKERLRERGFNQAEILARIIYRDTKFCISAGKGLILAKNALVRKKYTTPQAELGRSERLENLKEAFEIVETENLLLLGGKNILLVDDVTTTGATLEECAKALKQSGAKSVWGMVLAKGK